MFWRDYLGLHHYFEGKVDIKKPSIYRLDDTAHKNVPTVFIFGKPSLVKTYFRNSKSQSLSPLV